MAASISSAAQYFPGGYRINPHLEEVCDWLTDQGCNREHATFWNGNILTDRSNGDIEMWLCNDFNTMAPYQWLQKTSHARSPGRPVFLFATYEGGKEQTDRNKRCIVMAYDSANARRNAIRGGDVGGRAEGLNG